MTPEDARALARRMIDAWNRDDPDALDGVFAPDYLLHEPALPRGPEGAKRQLEAFPDLCLTIEAEIAEGDLVVQRLTGRGTHRGAFLGAPPTGRHVTFTSIEVMRVAEDKIAEHWDELDALGLLRQLGRSPHRAGKRPPRKKPAPASAADARHRSVSAATIVPRVVRSLLPEWGLLSGGA